MALVAAVCTHPRGGRFDSEGKPRRLERQSPALNVLGALILWAGWFFFNASGVESFSAQPDDVRWFDMRWCAIYMLEYIYTTRAE